MELTQLDMKKIKALHVTTKLPVYIIDKDNSLVTSYCSSYAHPLSYKLTEKKVPSRYVSLAFLQANRKKGSKPVCIFLLRNSSGGLFGSKI